MHRLIIGAPFGGYLQWPGTTPTLGTYTLHKRAGPWGRLWRVLKTVRYWGKVGGWVNKLGLPSPGIEAVENVKDVWMSILSIHGFDNVDWNVLAVEAMYHRPEAIEFNLSCPNTPAVLFDQVKVAVHKVVDPGPKPKPKLIAKLPPLRWMDLAIPLYAEGVRWFHACNTIPIPGGGLSGKTLKQYSLWAVEEIKQKWAEGVTVIGGGGITSVEDVYDYLRAGADHVAIASMLLNPFRWHVVPRLVKCLDTAFAR